MEYTPNLATVIAILSFFALYTTYMTRKTLRGAIDITDLAILWAVGILPAIFVAAPGFVLQVAALLGVEFPFVVLFGGLFVVVFIALFRLIVLLHRASQRIVVLTQELSLLYARLPEDSQ